VVQDATAAASTVARRGSLTVVGTGIAVGIHLTPQSREAIERADAFFHLAADPIAVQWLDGLRSDAVDLRPHYRVGAPRPEIYERITETILEPVRQGSRVCAAFYGHAGVYVRPSHEAVRRARAEGHDAQMFPAVSAEDCLFADLGVDPADAGCLSYDATDFLVHRRPADPAAGLVLWQITVIGDGAAVSRARTDALPALVDRLLEHYPAEHEVVVYEASPYPLGHAVVDRVPLHALPGAALTPLSTLYVPPASAPVVDAEMAARLGLSTH
jgi:uncharacterized protein YabN with tetrapyrrole methylase and pyrophosphatase domain